MDKKGANFSLVLVFSGLKTALEGHARRLARAAALILNTPLRDRDCTNS